MGTALDAPPYDERWQCSHGSGSTAVLPRLGGVTQRACEDLGRALSLTSIVWWSRNMGIVVGGISAAHPGRAGDGRRCL